MDGRHGRHGPHATPTVDQRVHKSGIERVKQNTVPGHQVKPRPASKPALNGHNGRCGPTVTSVAVTVSNPVNERAVLLASVTVQVVNVLHVIKASVQTGVNGVITVSAAMSAVTVGKYGVVSVMALVSVTA